MRHPDVQTHFWAVPLQKYTGSGELGIRKVWVFQDCCKSSLTYEITESKHKILTINEEDQKKNLKITAIAKQGRLNYEVINREPSGSAISTFNSDGQLDSVVHLFNLGEEKLKFVVDFADGNQWYLYQYKLIEGELKEKMLDRGNNIPEPSEFAHLNKLTTLVSHFQNEELGSLSLANKPEYCFIQVNLTNKPTLGIYIPKEIPISKIEDDTIRYLTQFPRHLFEMLTIAEDSSSDTIANSN